MMNGEEMTVTPMTTDTGADLIERLSVGEWAFVCAAMTPALVAWLSLLGAVLA